MPFYEAVEEDDFFENTRFESTNRRRHLRMPITTLATTTSEGTREETKVFIRDISIAGIGGYSPLSYQKGDRLWVTLRLSLSKHETYRDSLMGIVRWSTKVDKGKRYAFGLEFCKMRNKHARLLAYLQELEDIFNPS